MQSTVRIAMDSPAVSSLLFSTTLTFRTPQEIHIVSVPFDTIEKKTKNMFFSIFLVSPGHLGTIQNLIPGWTTFVKLLKQVKNWQSPSRDPWSNCLINSRETTKGQINYYSGRPKDNSKTICGRVGYFKIWHLKYLLQITKISSHPLNQPSPLL